MASETSDQKSLAVVASGTGAFCANITARPALRRAHVVEETELHASRYDHAGAGHGANTTIFSVVNAVLLRPLPYPEPERLAQVRETWPPGAITSGYVSPNNLADWREQARSFDALGAYWLWLYTLTGTNEPTEVAGMKVSANFFATLGVAPQLGRAFLPEEGQPEKCSVVIISYGFWQRRIHSASGAAGGCFPAA